MAFLKLVALSTVLGGGLGYVLLKIASPNESELKKHLPPYSSERHSLFTTYKHPPKFMNLERPNASFKDFKPQNSVNDTEK